MSPPLAPKVRINSNGKRQAFTLTNNDPVHCRTGVPSGLDLFILRDEIICNHENALTCRHQELLLYRVSSETEINLTLSSFLKRTSPLRIGFAYFFARNTAVMQLSFAQSKMKRWKMEMEIMEEHDFVRFKLQDEFGMDTLYCNIPWGIPFINMD